MARGIQSYTDKEQAYFTGERRDFIDRLAPSENRAIIEIGCGDGATGAYAKRTGKCGKYVGVELFAAAARQAERVLDEVYIADIEKFEFPQPDVRFDVLIASEVLKHLVDPWATLKMLSNVLNPGALLMASSPNIAHYSTLIMLLNGRWDLASRGRMDRTHLRWFTPSTYSAMFEECGFSVISTEPLVRPGMKARFASAAMLHKLDYLFTSQIVVIAQKK